jgi:hypothetical protein
MTAKYDVVIVGAGPAGAMCAYELHERNPQLAVLLVDKGNDIEHRRCPILEKKLTKCPERPDGVAGCYPACSITNGFGGSGAYSDGKFNITSEYGGWMTDYLDPAQVQDLIEYVDAINLKFGAPAETTDPTTEKVREIERRGLAVGLKLLRGKVRHLGTEVNLQILKNLYDDLAAKITMRHKTEVTDVLVENGAVRGVVLKGGERIEADRVVVCPGRDGSRWLSDICEARGIRMHANHVDIGVRVETNNEIMEEINRNLYEGKFIFRTSLGTQVRTFCSNPAGHVVIENFFFCIVSFCE